MTFNLASILRESARRAPDHPALVADADTLSYGELDARSDALGSGLIAAGLQAGDAVALQLPNIPEFVVSLYGILKAGGVVVPINTMYRSLEMSHVLRDASVRYVITTGEGATEAVAAADQSGGGQVFAVGDAPTGVAALPFDALLDSGASPSDGRAPLVQADPGATAVLLYSSGTTGQPKGVQLTHFQLYMNADAHVHAFAMDRDSKVIAVMPLFHALGLSGILNATILAGGTVLLLPRFDTEQVLDAIAAHGATIIHGVPTMYHSILSFPRLGDYDTSTLRMCGSAGAAIAAEVIDQVEQTLGVHILEMYGLTESGPLATMNIPSDRRPYSIGKAIPGTEVEIWGKDNRRLAPGADNVGEIVIRGHNTMSGYLNNPQATAEVFTDGWLHTGDLAYADEDGFLFFVGRTKELIIRGGYNVYPREVEEVLYQHPKVAEAAVLGVPDERLGEEVTAFITLKPGESAPPEEFVTFVKNRIAPYKYPRSVEILDSMPKGPTGKILKKELRSRYLSETATTS